MSFRGSDLKVLEKGWYHEGNRVEDMKESESFINFEPY